MEIKTCEEYVLNKLNQLEEIECMYNELFEVHKKVLNKYDTLRETIYKTFKCKEINSSLGLQALSVIGAYSDIYSDDKRFSVLKETIDDWARTVEKETNDPVEE